MAELREPGLYHPRVITGGNFNSLLSSVWAWRIIAMEKGNFEWQEGRGPLWGSGFWGLNGYL
jgi:hypothetical protein